MSKKQIFLITQIALLGFFIYGFKLWTKGEENSDVTSGYILAVLFWISSWPFSYYLFQKLK